MKIQPASKLNFLSWLNLAIGLFLAVRACIRLSDGQRGIGVWFTAGVATWCLFRWFSDWRASRARPAAEIPAISEGPEVSESGGDAPLRSLVLLLDQPRTISGKAWIHHLGAALGVDLSESGDDARNFVMPMPHPMLKSDRDACYMLKIPCGVFWILHCAQPYFDDVEGWATKVADRRIREAVAGHRAWISVDLVSWFDGPEDAARIYDVLGKAVAALAGPDALAIVCPELEQANEFSPELLPRLAGGAPLEIFENPTFAPVLEAAHDDEQMEAAIAEARRRWPEFVALFKAGSSDPDRPFLVKARFSSGEIAEHMWMIVNAVDDAHIHGTLANQPHRLPDHHEGQQVTVELSELSDWLCADEHDQPLGGWTQKVLSARQPRRN